MQEAGEALMALPARQRWALTVWGLRDRDSWLRGQPGGADDAPLLFDAEGRPKLAARALAKVLA